MKLSNSSLKDPLFLGLKLELIEKCSSRGFYFFLEDFRVLDINSEFSSRKTLLYSQHWTFQLSANSGSKPAKIYNMITITKHYPKSRIS